MKMFSVVLTLFLIMDPLGNVPLFLSALKDVKPERRWKVLVREVLFAYVFLLAFLLLGRYLLRLLGLQQETISIAGGIILFLIALRMIFPPERGSRAEQPEGEPFIVPLAIPMIAGPSILAALLLLQSGPNTTTELLIALTIAWGLSAAILLSSTLLNRLLRQRGLIAMERLMGMLLVMVAVQMFMNGVARFLN
ncbi:MAG TPA: YhgN family NAAT transporter [Pyrinomonadaceae bacterium]|nr:YhgN family NAAT transporter [Pyrinomonadaceae bacterium]